MLQNVRTRDKLKQREKERERERRVSDKSYFRLRPLRWDSALATCLRRAEPVPLLLPRESRLTMVVHKVGGPRSVRHSVEKILECILFPSKPTPRIRPFVALPSSARRGRRDSLSEEGCVKPRLVPLFGRPMFSQILYFFPPLSSRRSRGLSSLFDVWSLRWKDQSLGEREDQTAVAECDFCVLRCLTIRFCSSRPVSAGSSLWQIYYTPCMCIARRVE